MASEKWVEKPWGRYKVVWTSKDTKVKILTVYPGKRTSLQYHNHRSEFFTLLNGELTLEINGRRNVLRYEGQRACFDKKALHRLSNRTKKRVTVIEVQKGKCIENDIIRLEDDYGRIKTKANNKK